MIAKTKTRILHVIATSAFGGAQDLVLNLCRITRDDYDVSVVTTPGGVLIDQLREAGITVYELHIERNNHPLVAARLRKLIRDVAPDIVHAHDARAAFMSSLAVGRAQQPRILYHIQIFNPWRERFNLNTVLDRVAHRKAARVIACSEFLKGYLEKEQRFDGNKIVPIPNCIDTERFAPRPATGAEDEVVLMTCVRLVADKGLAYLIDAMGLLHRNLPQLRLVIAGEGELRERLEQQVRDLGLEDVITFAGYIDDVPAALAASDIYVQPSLVEGIPLSVLQAMSMAKPVVATAVSGTPEVVRHEETGLTVPSADAKALASAIQEMVNQPARREAYARAGAALVESGYSLASLREKAVNVYQQVLREVA